MLISDANIVMRAMNPTLHHRSWNYIQGPVLHPDSLPGRRL